MMKEIVEYINENTEYFAELKNVVKSGMEVKCIVVGTENTTVRPVFYRDNFKKTNSIEENANIVINYMKADTHEQKEVAINNLHLDDFNWVADKLIRCVGAEDKTEKYVRRHLVSDIYEYVRIDLPELQGTVCVTPELILAWEVTAEQLFNQVAQNDLKNCPYIIEDAFLLTIGTNKTKRYGASALAYNPLLKELSKKLNGSYYIIPSSVHEFLAVTADMASPSELADMIRTVNADMDPSDVLSDKPILYNADIEELVEV